MSITQKLWLHSVPGQGTQYGSTTIVPGLVKNYQQMQAIGIDAFSCDMFAESAYGSHIDIAMQAGDLVDGFVVAGELDLSVLYQADTDSADMITAAVSSINFYLELAAQHTCAAKTTDDKYILWLYGSHQLAPTDWQSIFTQVDRSSLYFIGDLGGNPNNDPFPTSTIQSYIVLWDACYQFLGITDDSIWTQIVSTAEGAGIPLVYSMMPRYYRPGVTQIDALGSKAYRHQCDRMLTANPANAVIITAWEDGAGTDDSGIFYTPVHDYIYNDLTSWYAAKYKGTVYPATSPTLYVSIPTTVAAGETVTVETLVINPTTSSIQASASLSDGTSLISGLSTPTNVSAGSIGDSTLTVTLSAAPGSGIVQGVGYAGITTLQSQSAQVVSTAPTAILYQSSSSDITIAQGYTYNIDGALDALREFLNTDLTNQGEFPTSIPYTFVASQFNFAAINTPLTMIQVAHFTTKRSMVNGVDMNLQVIVHHVRTRNGMTNAEITCIQRLAHIAASMEMDIHLSSVEDSSVSFEKVIPQEMIIGEANQLQHALDQNQQADSLCVVSMPVMLCWTEFKYS